MHAKPVVVLDPDGLFGPLWAYLETLAARGFVRRAAFDALQRVTTVEAALGYLDVDG
jgi:predicted Rossmann-fold nucleotide-binding protein